MMGSYMNFKNFGEAPQSQGNGAKVAVGTPLDRQSSVYSLTFEEFQNTLGGSGKDFGSMNMDELLKNIWTAEETQAMAASTVVGGQLSSVPSGNLLRQGSLTLPRTLSQKTVDEVWKELFKENSGINVKDVGPTGAGSNMQPQQRQPTFGEVTLEEFLFRAGVVREDARTMNGPNDNGSYSGGSSMQPNNNPQGLNIGFSNNLMPNHQPSSLPMNISGLRPTQPQLLQPLFPKQATVTFASSAPAANNTQFVNSGTRGTTVGIADPGNMNGALLQGGVMQGGPLGLGTVASTTKMGATSGSPSNQVSPDVLAKSNGDTSSVSPPPYMLGGGVRGRKSGTLEKAMERRHRRMIKNRESAARSRARKQAYTLELEAEVAKLKEMNEELRKKQEEFMEVQKNQALETMKMPWGNKRRCLRRTLTGPW